MKYIKNDKLINDKLSKGFVYFIQRMDELLFNYSLATYKPMALNTPSLCVEALRTIKEIKNNNINEKNIVHILDELNEVLKGDTAAKKLILADANFYTNFNESIILEDLSDRLSLLERSLDRDRYTNKIIELLLIAISNSNISDIDHLSKNLITVYENRGVSKRFLYQEFYSFFFTGDEIDNDSFANEFFERLKPIGHLFSVYFKVSNEILKFKDSFKYFKINVVDESDEKLDPLLKEKLSNVIFNPKNGYCLIKIDKIRSFDPFTAREQAERELETLKNTSQLYYHNTSFYWTRKSIAVQDCCSSKIIIVNRNINPMISDTIFSPSDVVKKTNWVFKNISLQGESFYKFNRAIELHSNSVHNLQTENQLVNLWTIFETIVPTRDNTAKVNNIINEVIPIILFKYYSKILDNLYKDLKRWNKSTLHSIISTITENGSNLEKMVIFLCDTKYDTKLQQLYSDLDDFHLLRSRIFKIREFLLDKNKLLKNLNRHEKNVVWQIHRIYRTRNLIVHSGVKATYINTLISNTHDYIDQIIFEIINLSTSSYHVYTLKQSFGISKLKYKDLIKTIEGSKSYKSYFKKLI
ncbi:MAG: hypothetical protein OCD02_11410 [Spirochaetaceae bacterium]